MQTMRTLPALGAPAQSTRRQEPAARGYHPSPAPIVPRALRAALRGLRALTAALRPRRRPYSEPELVVAFLTGLLLAACTFLPFLPR